VDAIGTNSYEAQYDAAGNMTCRTPTNAAVCTSTSQTGARFTYDAEDRLIQWVSANGATTVNYGYDGEGNRVEMQVMSGSTTTTTTYLSNLEEITVSGSTTTTTAYLYFNGQRVAEYQKEAAAWYYPLDDGLNSTTVVVNSAGVVAAQLFAPYGQLRWAGGTMPTTYGFTGQRSDSATGLDYYIARYYDPAAGTFTSADSVLPGGGMDPAGLDRYAYVEDNPTTHLDSNGHCWPFCTMLIGAVVGAVVGAATSVVTQVASGQGVNWGEVGKQAAIGAVSGAISGLAGPEAGPFVRGAVDGVASAAGQMVSNALEHKPLMDGVLEAGVEGAAMSFGMGAFMKIGGKLLKGAGRLVHSASDDVEGDTGAAIESGDTCGLSFSADTKVATPNGERDISNLKVGDQVLAYDPQTKQTTIQTVQHVFINHDTDLVDVKLRTENTTPAPDGAKPQAAANGQHQDRAPPQTAGQDQAAQPLEETVHTTAKHPFLTVEQGWVQAGQLQPGFHILRADGSIGVVEGVQVIPGAGTRYDLTVSNVHTFEVGSGQWVVHNCTPEGKRANKIAQSLKRQMKRLTGNDDFGADTTIGVGINDKGEILTSLNEGGASPNNLSVFKKLVNKLGFKYIGPDNYLPGGRHAEEFFFDYVDGGGTLEGLGASNRICSACEKGIDSRGLRNIVGTEFRGY